MRKLTVSHPDQLNLQPLRITAHFMTSPICDPWLPLDGILLFQVMRQEFGAQEYAVPGATVAQAEPAPVVPLKIIHPGQDNWYYACSWAQPQPWWIEEDLGHWHKRFRTEYVGLIEFGKRRGKVDIGRGKYRPYRMPTFRRVALSCEWYCVGDRERIAELLSTCTGVGKKRAYGEGAIRKWEVEPWPEDWSVWRGDRLTRGIPIDDWQAVRGDDYFIPMRYGIRPPYWLADNQMTLVRPWTD